MKEDEAVIGAVLDGPEGQYRIRARKGVVLATGGIARNPQLRAQLYPEAAQRYSLAPETNTGDGVAVALRDGAALANGFDSPGLWMPCSILRHPNGTEPMWPHIILDRAKPGLIAVNSAGRRFVNEANSYHDFVMGMLRSQEEVDSVPSYLICDRSFLRDYILGMVFTGTRRLKRYLDAGYLFEAGTLLELAAKIDVDGDALEHTVAEHNRYAETGVDEAFGRGSTTVNRFNGDPTNSPNPCLRAIGPGPYYAMSVWPADLASSVGLRGDKDGRVLDDTDRAIPGLYACGNDLSSIFRGTYPGPGTTLGPAIVFAWRLAQHAAHRNSEQHAEKTTRQSA